MKPPKPKRCKEGAEGCHGEYVPRSSFQKTCPNPLCGLRKGLRDRVKLEEKAKQDQRRDLKARKEKAKSRNDWLKEAQTAFNIWIRKRDEALPCISCGKYRQGQYAAGHFYTRKARPDLRFNQDNVHKQCNFYCNNALSGNIENFRPRLIEKIGQDRFDALQVVGRSDWDIDEIKEMRDHFRELAKS